SLSLQPKSDISDFSQFVSGRTRVNPSSAASGGGGDVALGRRNPRPLNGLGTPSIPVMVRLVRPLGRHANIGRLLVGHSRQLGADLGEVETGDLLVEGRRPGVKLFS